MFSFKSPLLPKSSLIRLLLMVICLTAGNIIATKSSKSMDNYNNLFNPDDDNIVLPEPSLTGTMSLEEVLQNRRSVRDFQDVALSLREVSQILWAAYGISYPVDNAPGYLRGGYKTAPSAGARYPLEIYIMVEKVEDLEAGIYRYMPENHSLKLEFEGSYRNQLFEASMRQDMILEAPVSLVYTAIYSRTTDRYGDRGRDRYVCMDLGHSAQNVYLQAETLGLGTCAVGAFDDRLVSNVLALPEEETPLYIMPLGKIN